MSKQIFNRFGWSKSRNTIFETCQRSYFLRYYESWEGWERTAPQPKREAYVLKNLENRFSWSGKVAHDVVSRALEIIRGGLKLEPDVLIEDAHRTMRLDFQNSKAKRYWTERSRKAFGGLMEHEHDEVLPPETWPQLWAATKASLQWWFNSRWPKLAAGLKPEQWLATDTKDFENLATNHLGVRFYGLPDFAFLDDTGAKIVDWKTGVPRSGFDGGIVGYAIFLQEKFGIDATTTHGWMVYLHDGTEKHMAITQDKLDGFNEHYELSVRAMQAKLNNVDGNSPKSIEDFPKTHDAEACGRCAYRRVCKREKPS